MTRPEWVPQRIWELYSRVREQYVPLTPEAREVLDRVMADSQCAVVWKAIEIRWTKALEKFPDTADKDGLATNDAELLIFRIPVIATMGLSSEDKTPAATRARQGRKIAQAAMQLQAALLEARFEENWWPYPLRASLASEIWTKANRTTRAQDSYDLSQALARCMAYDSTAATEALCESLTAVGNAGEAWANWDSVVPRPGHPNAVRLYFIRETTALFRRTYGTPLRDQVAALTRSIYQCDMDSATVASLAP